MYGSLGSSVPKIKVGIENRYRYDTREATAEILQMRILGIGTIRSIVILQTSEILTEFVVSTEVRLEVVVSRCQTSNKERAEGHPSQIFAFRTRHGTRIRADLTRQTLTRTFP